MNCKTVRKHIPAYAEKELSGDLSITVRAHIDACPGCARELAEYENYFALMSKQPELKAPDGFLASLHRKLDLPGPQPDITGEKGILKKLFYPVWPKLPLEAAGLLATAALVFVVLKPSADFQKTGVPEILPPPSVIEKRVTPSLKKPAGRFSAKEKSDGVRREETLHIASGDRESLSDDRRMKKAARSAPREREGPADKAEPVTLILVLNNPIINKQADEYEPAASGMMKNMEEAKKSPLDKDLAAAKQYRGPYPLSEKDEKGVESRKATERVRRIVGRYGGTILDERYSGTTGLLEMLEVSIPSGRYDSFIADLKSEGTLKGVSDIRISRKQSIKLRLNIESAR